MCCLFLFGCWCLLLLYVALCVARCALLVARCSLFDVCCVLCVALLMCCVCLANAADVWRELGVACCVLFADVVCYLLLIS